MPKKPAAVVDVSMEDVFNALRHCEDDHGVRLALLVFPVQSEAIGARFGLAVKAYDDSGRLIRDLVCSSTYWPSAKYTTWEAAALACIYTLEKEITETYLPLLNYLARNGQ